MGRRCLATTATEQVYPYHEPGAMAGHRRRLLRRASGRVLDLSARWSPNLPCYRPGAVDSLTVSSPPIPYARPLEWSDEELVDRPAVLGLDLDALAGGSAPGDMDAAFDTVVAVMTLCTVTDLDATLGAMGRWLRPGGRLLLLEHVLGTGLTGLAQRVAGPVGSAFHLGCRPDRDLAPALRRAGYDLTDAARFSAWIGAAVPTPCLAGVARLHPDRARPAAVR